MSLFYKTSHEPWGNPGDGGFLGLAHSPFRLVGGKNETGKGDPTFRADGAPKMTENLLIARRLVEAGARVVSLNFSRWDWHGGNFSRARQDMPMLDQAVSALVEDLHERGLDRDVSVVVWGEFGLRQSPRVRAERRKTRLRQPRSTLTSLCTSPYTAVPGSRSLKEKSLSRGRLNQTYARQTNARSKRCSLEAWPSQQETAG